MTMTTKCSFCLMCERLPTLKVGEKVVVSERDFEKELILKKQQSDKPIYQSGSAYIFRRYWFCDEAGKDKVEYVFKYKDNKFNFTCKKCGTTLDIDYV